MSSSRRADVAGGTLIAVLGLAIATISRDFSWFGEGGRVGSGLVAGFSGLTMAALGAVIVGKAFVGKAYLDAGPTDAEELRRPVPTTAPGVDGDRPMPVVLTESERPRDLRSTLGVLLATLGAIFLTPRIGFLAAFALLLFVVVLLVERASWRVAVTFTALTIGTTWLVFVYALEVPLPAGPFGGR